MLSLHFHYLISNQEYNFECINFVLRKNFQSVFEFISIYEDRNHQKSSHNHLKKKVKKEKQSWQTSHSYAEKAEKQSN